ncbi:MAG TPA: AAA family ATPase, partial [Solirubrobacteraceae bacterium]|nr:AAA family ATPase [Solirubrobacteraceae bacterium]
MTARAVTEGRRHPAPLVERDEELACLDDVLHAARSGAGATVVIEGPAGIGKTSLLTSAREKAVGSGMSVLQARGSPLEREYAMGLVRQCLERTVRADPAHEELFAGAARLARAVVLDIPGELDAAPVGVLHGLYWLLADLAERAALLVAIDDAQWADDPSLRFLAYLTRRVETLPVALVICVRAGGDAATEAMLASITDDPSSEVLRPRPLPLAGVERFLRVGAAPGSVEEDFVRACHDATGGNPFLLEELVRALRAEGVPFTAAGAARLRGVTPATVAHTVRATLDRLMPGARALARAVAVLGEDVELDLAAEVARVRVDEAAFVAGELTRAGILDDATPLRFRHPILAGAVRADLAAPERAAAHRRAADLLRVRGAGAERVALQLMRTSPSGDESVVGQLRLAAERARGRGAPGTAAALLRRALAEPPAAAARAELLLELGRAEYAMGESGEAALHLEDAQRCAVDPATRGRALIELFQSGPGGLESRRTIGPLIDQALLDVRDRDRELALRLRAIQILMSGSPGDAATLRNEGRGLTGATPGEAVLLGHLTFVRMRAEASAAEIAAIAERASRQADVLLEDGATSLVITGIVLPLRWADRLESAERVLDRAVAVARRRGSTTDFANALTQRAAVHHRAGRLAEAEADARSALAADIEPAWTWSRPSVTPLLAALIDQGRVEDAALELAAAHPADEVVDAPPMTPLLLGRMRLRAAQGDHRRARADWEEAVRRAQRLFGISPAWIEDLGVAAEVHLALGDPDSAQALVARALALAERWDTPGAMGQALHTAARVGPGDDAVEVLRDAVDHLARSPARLEHARALITLGRL